MINLINQTLKSSWGILLLCIIIFSIFRYFSLTNSRKKIKIYEEVNNFLFIIYVFLLANIISYGELNISNGFNLVPFKEITRYTLFSDLFMLNIVGNIVLFCPLGYFMGYYIKSKKASLIMMLSAVISVIGEVLQHYVGRTFDIDDIILNVVGALIGYLVYETLHFLYRKLPNFLQKDGLYNILCIIIIGILVIYILDVIEVINII